MNSRLMPLGIIALIAALIVISFFSIDLFVYVQAKLSQRGVAAAYLSGATVLLDKRLKQHEGSWTLDLRMHNAQAVQLVYDALEEMLQHKTEVILIDVGANSGSVALLPTLSKKIKVFAFDPNIQVADMLRSNVELNKLNDNVTVIPIGLSDKTALLNLHIPGQAASTGYATFADKILRFNKQQGTTMTALVEPLDLLTAAMLQDNQKIDLIKIDTEGWEYFVLKGARETIARFKPSLFIYFNPDLIRHAGADPQDIHRFLQNLNYQCRLFGSEDLWCQQAH